MLNDSTQRREMPEIDNKKPYILIINDNVDELMTYGDFLKDVNCTLLFAKSGNEALLLILQYDFAGIVLDEKTIRKNGLEIPAFLQSDKKTYKTPLIFLADNRKISNNFKKLWHEQFSFDYLVKPLDADLLRSKITILCELYHKNFSSKKVNQLILRNKLLEELTTIDFLTKIPNRSFFEKTLKLQVERAKRYHDKFALMLIDVDNFKIINDTHGHDVGDSVLKGVTERIQSCVRSSDLLSRLGGDEFAIILERVSSARDAIKVAKKILDVFNKAFHFLRANIHVTISIGIACYPENASDQEILLKNADIALYSAKQLGRNNYQFYQEDTDKEQKKQIRIASALQTIEKNKEFSLVYQPVIDLKTGKPSHLEALLRWKSPELGVVPPDVFIPLAEKSGQISSITEWVIEHVAETIAIWKKDKTNIIPIAINLSAMDLRNRDLILFFKSVLNKYQLRPNSFQIEITETVIMQDQKISIDNLLELKKMGISITIDDFGTGYSSLARLHALPVSCLKIDISFTQSILNSKSELCIVDAIILLSKKLNLKTIAEGVEISEQAAILKRHACDYAQGYFFCKPSNFKTIQMFLKKFNM